MGDHRNGWREKSDFLGGILKNRRQQTFRLSSSRSLDKSLSKMLGGIDYSKWKSIGYDDEDDDIDDADERNRMNHAMSSTNDQGLQFMNNLTTYKVQADELFVQAERSKDPYDYRVALNEGYQALLAKASSILRDGDVDDASRNIILHNDVSCRLNAACCFLKLEEWDSAIEECTWVLTEQRIPIKHQQQVRARYFRSYSYLKLRFLAQAEQDARQLKSLLEDRDALSGSTSTTAIFHENEAFLVEYNNLFQVSIAIQSIPQI